MVIVKSVADKTTAARVMVMFTCTSHGKEGGTLYGAGTRSRDRLSWDPLLVVGKYS